VSVVLGLLGVFQSYKGGRHTPVALELNATDIAKTILYSAASVRGVFVANREEFKQMVSALETGGVEPIIDKVSPGVVLRVCQAGMMRMRMLMLAGVQV
jgi:D-arabinose 1-dehydrogenase-like Zn-dependent alcohol dehydrogenase